MITSRYMFVVLLSLILLILALAIGGPERPLLMLLSSLVLLGCLVMQFKYYATTFKCPDCGIAIPKHRQDASRKGWKVEYHGLQTILVCPQCGCRTTDVGQKVSTASGQQGQKDA
jgi:hypothetical protein